MKTYIKPILASLAVIGVLTSFTLALKTNMKVDTQKSTITWDGKKVTGAHTGHISIKEGSLEVEGKKLTGGAFVIDMNTITCTDLKDAEYNANFVGHLKSDDFFGVEKHQESKLLIKSVKQKEKNNVEITGDLTIKGKTLPITFPATVETDGKTLKATAKITIDRTKYEIKYGSGSFFDNLGDKAIDNNFTLTVELVASK
jgi:polyisoprenoid-binding protein YceI